MSISSTASQALKSIRITTAQLVLRLPESDEWRKFAAEVAGRVVPSGAEHFVGGWAQLPSPEFEDAYVAGRRRRLETFAPEKWGIELGAFEQEQLVGQVSVYGQDWPANREVTTASLVHPDLRGAGLGTEMRVAVLSFAFEVLGASTAWSGASLDNVPSNRVSEKLGYAQVGVEQRDTGAGTTTFTRLRLAASEWKPVPGIEVEGGEPVRRLLLG